MQVYSEEDQVCLFDPDLWSGKTSPEPSPAAARREKIFGSSSKKSWDVVHLPKLRSCSPSWITAWKLCGKQSSSWVSISSDVNSEIYEGLLQKNAEDIKSGAGQYLTPRLLTKAMVKRLRPQPEMTIADPCCGSGGFFPAIQELLTDPNNYALSCEDKQFLKNKTFHGNELVRTTFKMALMNLYLHNIGDIYGNVLVTLGDTLLTYPGYQVDYMLTNPPFGKKSSISVTNKEG